MLPSFVSFLPYSPFTSSACFPWFRHGVVPPPLCAVCAGCSRPVNHVAILDADDEGCEVVAVVLSNGHLGLIRSVEEDLWEETLEVRIVMWCESNYLA